MRFVAKSIIVAASVAALASVASATGHQVSTKVKSEISSGGVRADHAASILPTFAETDFTTDIDMAGWITNGSFTDPTNTHVVVPLAPSAFVTGVEWLNLNFDAINGSWRSEFVISTNQSDDNGLAGNFWDMRPASSLTSGGNYTGSGAFTAPSNQFSSGPFQLLADGNLLVYVYESFDDAGVQDSTVNSGTLRVHWSDNAPPPPPAPVLLFSGDLADSDPDFNRPSSLTTLSGVGTAVNYDLTAFTVTETGTYSIEQRSTDVDSHITVYTPTFDPNNPLATIVGIDDDGGDAPLDSKLTMSLTAGVQYYLVDSSFDNGEVGDYDVYYTGTATGGIIVIPEPTTIAGLSLVTLLVKRRRVA